MDGVEARRRGEPGGRLVGRGRGAAAREGDQLQPRVIGDEPRRDRRLEIRFFDHGASPGAASCHNAARRAKETAFACVAVASSFRAGHPLRAGSTKIV